MSARIFPPHKGILYQSLQLNQVDICQSEKDGDLQSKLQAIKTAEEEDFGHSQIGQVMENIISHSLIILQMRSWLWQTVEYPHTSSTAQTLAWLSLSMVLVSTVTFIVSTAEVLQGQRW